MGEPGHIIVELDHKKYVYQFELYSTFEDCAEEIRTFCKNNDEDIKITHFKLGELNILPDTYISILVKSKDVDIKNNVFVAQFHMYAKPIGREIHRCKICHHNIKGHKKPQDGKKTCIECPDKKCKGCPSFETCEQPQFKEFHEEHPGLLTDEDYKEIFKKKPESQKKRKEPEQTPSKKEELSDEEEEKKEQVKPKKTKKDTKKQ